MRSRPEIEFNRQTSVRPGDDVPVAITLRSASDTPVERIELTLTGIESAREPDGSGAGVVRTVHTSSLILCGEGVLTEGTHTFEGKLPLPVEMPFTYIGYASEVRYSVKARVEIPWWPDAEESLDLLVTPRPEARPARQPATITTENGERPFVEMALDDRAFAPGEEITGVIALGNVRGQRVRGMDVSLVAVEHLRVFEANSERAVEAQRITRFVKVEASDEGREIPFKIPIPKEAAPSFDEGLMALVWCVEVRVNLGLESDAVATLPIALGSFERKKGSHEGAFDPGAVIDAKARSGGPSRPRIGSGRWRDVWSGVGAQSGLSLAPDELRLTGLIHGYEASVALGDASDKGGAIVAELEWPSFALGLHIEPVKLSLALFAAEDELSRRYRVRSRDASQVAVFLTPPLRSALLAFDSVELEDDRARLTSRGPGHDARWIAGFLQLVFAFAAAAREAASRIPPPPSMSSMLPEWQAFADELGGRLSVGSMSLYEGRLDGGSFVIETRFEGGSGGALPSRTVVSLELDPPLSKPFDASSSAALSAAPAGTREVVASILKLASALRVSEVRMEIDAAAPCDHPGSLRDVMRAMLSLAQRLGGDRRGGPYR